MIRVSLLNIHFDSFKVKEHEYIPYEERIPGVEVLFVENASFNEMSIFLHTKYDFPDVYQLNGENLLSTSNESKQSFWIDIKKRISKRESTRKIPCNMYEYATCKNIEDNKMILEKFDCHVPALYHGQHLDDLIPKEILKCSNEVTREAFDLILNKTSNCTRSPTCKMTRFTSNIKAKETYVKNTDLVWIAFANPEVANYNTYISYDLLSLIGEVGGILGLTLGASALNLIELFLHKNPYY